MAVRRVRGVALIVENPEGKILVLQECESKPHLGKYPGMFSIPMETSKPNEPVEITEISCSARPSPKLMMAPRPNCFSICESAALNALLFSSLISCPYLQIKN